MKISKIFSIIFFSAAIATIFFTKYNLRLIFKGNIILDIIPNFFTAISLPFLFYIFQNSKKAPNFNIYFLKAILMLILYEFSQLFDQKSVFDWFDIIASLLGALLAIILLKKVILYEEKRIR